MPKLRRKEEEEEEKKKKKSAQLGTEAGQNRQSGSFVCVWVIYFGRQALIYAAAAAATQEGKVHCFFNELTSADRFLASPRVG